MNFAHHVPAEQNFTHHTLVNIVVLLGVVIIIAGIAVLLSRKNHRNEEE